MSAIWTARFANQLRQLLGKHETTGLDAIDEVMPTMPLLDPAAPELLLLRHERMFAGWARAVVGVVPPVISLQNPAGSGVLVVVDKFWGALPNGGPAIGYWNVLPIQAAGVGAPDTSVITSMDTRGWEAATAGPVAAAVFREYNAVIGFSSQWLALDVPSGTARHLGGPHGPCVLSPGFMLVIVNTTAASLNCEMNARWRERRVEQGLPELGPQGA